LVFATRKKKRGDGPITKEETGGRKKNKASTFAAGKRHRGDSDRVLSLKNSEEEGFTA